MASHLTPVFRYYMYYKTPGACTADTLVQVDVLVHGSCYSPDPLYSFAPKCTPGSPFKTEQVTVCSLFTILHLPVHSDALARLIRPPPPLFPPSPTAVMLSFNRMFLRLFYDSTHRLLSCASIAAVAAAAAAAGYHYPHQHLPSFPPPTFHQDRAGIKQTISCSPPRLMPCAPIMLLANSFNLFFLLL
jgi:hypothetical protein